MNSPNTVICSGWRPRRGPRSSFRSLLAEPQAIGNAPSAQTFLVIPRYSRQVQVLGQARRRYPSSARFDENREEAKTHRAQRIAGEERGVSLSSFYLDADQHRSIAPLSTSSSSCSRLLPLFLRSSIPKHYRTRFVVSYRAAGPGLRVTMQKANSQV